MTWPGENHAWQRLAQLDPHGVQGNAGVTFDTASVEYELTCFGQPVRVAPKDRRISSRSATGALLVETLSEFSRLAILFYLCDAQGVPPTGQLITPSQVKGGTIFLLGTHVLPLDRLAQRFSGDREGLLSRGRELGGTPLTYGDMAIQLAAFPKLPIVLIVWTGDTEFPPRASLLLDSGASAHLRADVIWATANIAIALMLH